MSEDAEIAMGAEYDPQITAAYGIYQDDKLQDYIDTKGGEMARISHRPHLTYDFKIMDSPVVNAFAVPGGYVYFTRGIMAHFNNEAEFAGVLGHEIGHITARHSVVQQRNSTLAQIGLMAGMVVSPELASMAGEASEGVQLLLLQFGRDAESQSDELGVEYSSRIGYDASEMADFFGTLHRLSGESGAESIPSFMSTHPDPLNRKQKVSKLAAKWQSDLGMTEPKVGRESYLNMLDGLVYGEDPRQGFVENNTFYHPELKFQFPIPLSWQYQNSPQQLQMAPSDGKAIMMLMIATGNTLQEAANGFASSNKLEVINSSNKTLNGLQAVVVNSQQMQQGDDGTNSAVLRLRSTFIKYGDLIYNVTGMSLPADFPIYSGKFDDTMNNFKILTDQSKLNRQPDRLRIFRTSSSGTLQQALLGAGVPMDRMDEFSILNGMQRTDQVPQGTLLKGLK
jgi:predicted Zn-dependent protease